MKRLLPVVLAAFAACSHPASYAEYHPANGEFHVEVPRDWAINERGDFARRPIAEVWWVGKLVTQNEGWPIGAVLFVRRLDRHPAKGQERYRRDVLSQTDALFSVTHPADLSVKNGEASGHPARWFERQYDESVGGGMHGAMKACPSKVSGLAIQTADAYYVLEYHATQELFDRYAPAFERLTASWKLP